MTTWVQSMSANSKLVSSKFWLKMYLIRRLTLYKSTSSFLLICSLDTIAEFVCPLPDKMPPELP